MPVKALLDELTSAAQLAGAYDRPEDVDTLYMLAQEAFRLRNDPNAGWNYMQRWWRLYAASARADGRPIVALVTGDRFWHDPLAVHRELSRLPPGSSVVEGEAPGADTHARLAGRALGFDVRKHPANWQQYHRAAGPIRNAEMLRENADIDVILAFHANLAESKGTINMISAARRKSLPVVLFTE